MEKGVTHAMASERLEALVKPTESDVKIPMAVLRANSYPKKCIAIAKAIYSTDSPSGVIRLPDTFWIKASVALT
jgi:hypothetical protein